MSSKRVVLALGFCSAVIFTAALGFRFASSALSSSMDPAHSTTFTKGRWSDFVSQLPQIDFRGKDVYVFFGPSDVEMGIDPAQILQLAGLTTAEGVNIGFRSLPTEAIPFLLERAFRELRDRGAGKIHLVMKVPISSITSKGVDYFRRSETDDFLRAVADAKSFLAVSGLSLRGLDLFLKKALLGQASSSIFEHWLNNVLFPVPQTEGFRLYSEVVASKSILAEGHWPIRRRGKIPWEQVFLDEPRLRENASARRDNPSVVDRFQRGSGFLVPDLSPFALSLLQTTAGLALQYGVDTTVFQFPDYLSITHKRARDGDEKIDRINQAVTQLFHATFLNLGQGDQDVLGELDFLDMVHLNESGQKKVWNGLAKFLSRRGRAGSSGL